LTIITCNKSFARVVRVFSGYNFVYTTATNTTDGVDVLASCVVAKSGVGLCTSIQAQPTQKTLVFP